MNGYCQFLASVPADMPLSAAGYGTCSLSGCNAPKYRDPANGRIHDYCGRTHAFQALQATALGIVMECCISYLYPGTCGNMCDM